MIDRFNLSNAFGQANETVARVNQICKDAKARNQEDHQNATISVREERVSLNPTKSPRVNSVEPFAPEAQKPEPVRNVVQFDPTRKRLDA